MRSDATPRASPGGSASAYWYPVSAKSSCHRSVSTGEPATDVTASASSSTSSNSRTTAARASRSCNTPVDVSEWTTVTASTGERRSASRSMSGSTAQPGGTSSRRHSLPQACTSLANRSLKRSEEHTSELQSQSNLVCRLLLEKKKNKNQRSNKPNAISQNDDHPITLRNKILTAGA